MSLPRRLVWGAVGVSGAGVLTALVALYASRAERACVQLDRFVLELDRPGLPPEGITILHLSDLHFGRADSMQAAKVARLKRLLAGERFDMLALTGDLIHEMAGLPAALDLVASLPARLGTFFCPGNHDYAEYSVWGVFDHTWRKSGVASGMRMDDIFGAAHRLADFAGKVLRNQLVRLPVAFNDVPGMVARLQELGVQSLVNRAVPVGAEGTGLWVAGLDDLTEGRPDFDAALAVVPPGAMLVLLAHNPDVWLDPRVVRADLVLAGHTHGGQVRLPLIGAAHTQGTHLSRRKAAGWFMQEHSRMFVSRGLGESIPLRLGARPQAALIHLVPARVAT